MTSKEKKFIGILTGATVVCVGGLYFWANSGTSRYDAAKEQFDSASNEIRQMEGLALYPNDKNKADKQKALDAYKTSAEELATKLRAYSPKAIVNTDPQTFTDTLVKVAGETFKAYTAAGLKADGEKGGIPKDFYLGFENYKGTPAQKDATGILTFELNAISEIHQHLAAAKPSSLLNFYRVPLDEEANQAYTPAPGSSFRALPVEIAFSGPESTLRSFINSLQSSTSHFYVIRSMRVLNEKQSAPKASDVQFDENKKASQGAAAAAGGIFDGGDAFVLPDEKPAVAPAGAAAAPAAPAAAPEKPMDSSRILKQVLGDENVNAFFRIDIILFDAAAPATKGK